MTQTQSPKLKGKFSSATITKRYDMTEDLWRVWLRPETEFKFKPGQYITIGTQGVERPYSIASSPTEPEIELFIELIPYPEGELTPLLYELGVGAEVSIRPRPKGLFLFKPEYRNHLMVATVTGVTPYISMLRHYFENPTGEHRFFILEGASYHDEFGYADELRAMDEAHDEVTFVPSVSRPNEEKNAGWQGEGGRINTLVEKYLEKFELSPEDTLVYTCGHPLMIEDVKRRLEGTDFNVTEERFWKEEDEE